jgi:hypothetical protein
MKKLYEEYDLGPLIKEYIYPYLDDKRCAMDGYKNNSLHALRCVSKGLYAIPIDIIFENCQIINIGSKKICNIHCKALPLYQYIQNKYNVYQIHINVMYDGDGTMHPADDYIHFKHTRFANMFKECYNNKIVYENKKIATCCGGKGFKLKGCRCGCSRQDYWREEI